MENKFLKKCEHQIKICTDTIMPKYRITIEKIDGTNDWHISGKINDVSAETAKSVTLIAKPDKQKEFEEYAKSIAQNTERKKEEYRGKKVKFSKLVKWSFIGTLIAAGVIYSLKMFVKTKPEIEPQDVIIEETTETTEETSITMYGVSIETNIFEYMNAITQWDKSWKYKPEITSNITKLRGVENLHDNAFHKYSKDIDGINKNVSELISGKDIDFNDFLKQSREINYYSLIALEDVKFAMENAPEEDYDILDDNVNDIRYINYVSEELAGDITTAIEMKKEYPEATLFDEYEKSTVYSDDVCNFHSYVYGVHSESILLFNTLEEAQKYQEAFLKDFKAHLDKEEWGHYDGHTFDYETTIVKYDTEKSAEELQKMIETKKYLYGVTETEINKKKDSSPKL